MRTIQCDVGHSGELHKLYQEYCKDTGSRLPNVDFWLYNFKDPTFFCFMAKHGKKSVGFVLGKLEPYFDQKTVAIDAVFVRRGFRKMKFTRALVESSVDQLKKFGITLVAYNRTKRKERKL